MFCSHAIPVAIPASTTLSSPTPPHSSTHQFQTTSELAINILFNSICQDLRAGQSSLLNLQHLCVLSLVNKFFIKQIVRTWRARLCALTQNANMISTIQVIEPFLLHRIWFQLQRFNFSLNSMSKDNTLLVKATLTNCSELVELLLASLKMNNPSIVNARYGDATRTWNTTLLINSATRGQKEIVELLLNAKADLEMQNSKQQTALMSVVYALINPSFFSQSTKLFYSMAEYAYNWFNWQKERVEDRQYCMQALIHAKANVNVVNYTTVNTLLMDVSAAGQCNIMHALIAARANLNACNLTGHTALMYTIHHKKTEATRILLEAHADVHVRTHAGSTALTKAAQFGRASVVQMLIGARAKVDDADKEGSTAFMHAAYRGNLTTMKVLIAAKTNIHMYNKQGHTPLTYAAYHGNLNVVRFLIAAHADVRRCTTNGNTPIKLAISRGHIEIAVFLQQIEKEPCKVDIPELNDDSSDDDQELYPLESS